MQKRLESFAQLAVVFFLVAGCYLGAAAIPDRDTARRRSNASRPGPFNLWAIEPHEGQHNLAAFTMTLSLSLLVILPLALVAYNLADEVTAFLRRHHAGVESGPIAPPDWLKGIRSWRSCR